MDGLKSLDEGEGPALGAKAVANAETFAISSPRHEPQ
jgi:hypothetical protein